LNIVENAIQEYYAQEEKLPESLAILIEEIDYIQEGDIKNVVTKKEFDYEIGDEESYSICTDFFNIYLSSINVYSQMNKKEIDLDINNYELEDILEFISTANKTFNEADFKTGKANGFENSSR